MFGSTVLEIGIGLVFILALLSLICSVIQEFVASIWSLRSGNLYKGLTVLLQDAKLGNSQSFLESFLAHGKIQSLVKKGAKAPSYIPPKVYAEVVLDLLNPAQSTGQSKTITKLREEAGKIDAECVRQPLLMILEDVGNDVDQAKEKLAEDFDQTMDRASGWYKRKAQYILIGIALGVCVVLNADLIQIGSKLSQDKTLREALVESAESTVNQSVDGQSKQEKLAFIREQVDELSMPLGWKKEEMALSDPTYWFSKVIGILATVCACSLGAPFWFDLLRQLIRIRNSGKKPGEKVLLS